MPANAAGGVQLMTGLRKLQEHYPPSATCVVWI